MVKARPSKPVSRNSAWIAFQELSLGLAIKGPERLLEETEVREGREAWQGLSGSLSLGGHPRCSGGTPEVRKTKKIAFHLCFG